MNKKLEEKAIQVTHGTIASYSRGQLLRSTYCNCMERLAWTDAFNDHTDAERRFLSWWGRRNTERYCRLLVPWNRQHSNCHGYQYSDSSGATEGIFRQD